jgi:Schlafen, AlbA_2
MADYINWNELITRGIESDELDYKAAQNFKELSSAGKAKFVRHCLALANTKGGYLVIGVGEDRSGRPSLLTGLTDEQARSFDPSLVGGFINAHVDPPIDFTIERPVVNGKQYAVFVIRRFSNVPHVCSRPCDRELQQGVFYIRTPDASSRAAHRAGEIHTLIQRALRNQREELGRMLRGILYEQQDQTSDDNGIAKFREQRVNARSAFYHRFGSSEDILAEFSASPSKFDPHQFSNEQLRSAFDNALHLFPGSPFIDKAVINDLYPTSVGLRSLHEVDSRMWQFFYTGMLHFMRLFSKEDKSLDFNLVVKLLSEAIYFTAQYYVELGLTDEIINIYCRVKGLDGVKLEGLPNKITPPVFRGKSLSIQLERSAADLVSSPERHAERLLTMFFERFGLPRDSKLNLLKTVAKYQKP